MTVINRRQALSLAGAGIAASLVPSRLRAAPLTLNLSFGNAYWKSMFEQVVGAFKAQYPDVDIVLRPLASEPELSQAILRDAAVGTIPDIVFQGYGPMRITVDRGLALPLDRLIAAEADWGRRDYVPSLGEMSKIGSATYGIPFWASLPVIYYNLDMVERAGGNPQALPKDWPGILALSEKMKAAFGKQSFHYIYRNTDWNFQTLLFANGGRMMSAEEKAVTFAGPEGAKAFELLAQFGRSGMIPLSRDQARQAFGAGDLGILGGNASSHLVGLEKDAGSRFKLGVEVHPVPATNGRLPTGGGAFLILAKDEAKQRMAWEFLKFASGPVGQTIMVKATGALPVSLGAVKQKDQLGDYYAERPLQQKLLEGLGLLTGWYSFPGANANKIVSVIEDHVEKAVMLKLPADQALLDMKRQVETLLGLQG